MSAKNSLLASGKQPMAAADEIPSVLELPPVEPKDAGSDENGGSKWSHLLFGLVTLVLVSPMVIPGIPMNYLVVFYLGLAATTLAGCVIWNFLNARPPRR